MKKQIIVSGGFDDIRLRELHFLEEASKLGDVSVLLWPDELLQKLTGKTPKFPLAERRYFLNAVRFVNRVLISENSLNPNELPEKFHADVWMDIESAANTARGEFCRKNKIAYHVFKSCELKNFPEPPPSLTSGGKKPSSPAASIGFTPATSGYLKKSARSAIFL
jgi:glycerol-3-phosphate cytidylyltransferase-like family protein